MTDRLSLVLTPVKSGWTIPLNGGIGLNGLICNDMTIASVIL
jgi:hypothetical protein